MAGERKTWNCAVPDTKRFFKEICNLVQKVYRKFCCDKEQVYNYVNGDDSLAELVEWSFYNDSDFYMSSDVTMADVLEVIRQLLDKENGIG